MAADVNLIVKSLKEFYDFTGKDVINVGAGGGQLISYAHNANSVLAVDTNPIAVDLLGKRIAEEGLSEKVTAVTSDFCEIEDKKEVIFFEFCLHEMDNPVKALLHAKKLGKKIIIIDHLPESDWAYYALETEKLERSWKAIKKFFPKREKIIDSLQIFGSYEELEAKLSVLGEESLKRIEKLKKDGEIEIEMAFCMAEI